MFDFISFFERFIARDTASCLGRNGGLDPVGGTSAAEVAGLERRFAISSGVLCMRVLVGPGPGGRRFTPPPKSWLWLTGRWMSAPRLSSGSEVVAPGTLEERKLLARVYQLRNLR